MADGEFDITDFLGGPGGDVSGGSDITPPIGSVGDTTPGPGIDLNALLGGGGNNNGLTLGGTSGFTGGSLLPGALPVPTAAPTGLLDQLLSALNSRGGQAGIAGLGVGAGLLGLIQQLASGGPVTTVKRQANTTPQEQQLTGQTLQALQQLQSLAANTEINNAVKQLAAGQLPISPDLIKQVTGAFGATAGQLAQDSINNARERGFSGGTELLAGAGSPQYAQSLAQLQSDVSNALVNLAVGLPQAASNINAQQVGNAATGIGLQNDLLRALTAQNGFQQTSQTSGNLLNSLGPFASVLGGTGGLIAGLNSFNKPDRPSVTLNLGGGSSGTGGGGLSG